MKISRELAIKILKYLDQHKDFYFPFLVMCQEYTEEDDDFVEVETDEWKMISSDEKYQTFELWENLQNLDEETLELMVKGFLEKINGEIETGEYFKNMQKEKQGTALIKEAEKMGVAVDGIYGPNKDYVREGALQQRIRNAKNTKYAQLTWVIALVSAVASLISAIAAWTAISRR